MLAPPRVLFSGLIDDAAVFPPRSAGTASAVAMHLTWRNTPHSDLVGPFVCPAALVEEMCVALPADDYLHVSLVLDSDISRLLSALDLVNEDPRLILVAVEAAHQRLGKRAAELGEQLARLPDVVTFLEVSKAQLDRSLALVTNGPWQLAKYRTGGVMADSFPTEPQLAEFLLACATRDVPFKLTAGLHHAARNYDHRTGFQQHGVLNVLLATDVALDGGSIDAATSLLGQRSADVLSARLRQWESERCARVRDAFRSFGCCDPAEPIAELEALRLLETQP